MEIQARSESTGGHPRKQFCALSQEPTGPGTKTAWDAHPAAGQARCVRYHNPHHEECLGWEDAVPCPSSHPSLSSPVQPWAKQLPLGLEPEIWDQLRWRLGCIGCVCPVIPCLLVCPIPQLSFPCAAACREGKHLSTYMWRRANVALLLPNVWKAVYKHVIFTAALYCYKQDSFMM